MLSAILFDGLRRLHFREENAKVIIKLIISPNICYQKLADACRLAFQQDMAQRSWNDSDSGSTRQPRLRFTIIIIIIMERAYELCGISKKLQDHIYCHDESLRSKLTLSCAAGGTSGKLREKSSVMTSR